MAKGLLFMQPLVGVIPPQVQDSVFVLVEFHKALVGSLLQPV